MPRKHVRTLTKAEFARTIGVTRQRVNTMLHDGLPVRPDGLIEVPAALKWVEENVAPRAELGDGDNATLVALRAEKLRIETELARLELAERQGELVTIEDATAEWAGLVSRCRARLLGIPVKLAATLAVESDRDACRVLVQTEIHDALRELAGNNSDDDLVEVPDTTESATPVAAKSPKKRKSR